MKNVIQITRLHLEILYQLKSEIFMNEINLKSSKVKLNGGFNIRNRKFNLVKILKNSSPLFFNEFSDSIIKTSIIDIIKNTHKNKNKRTKIYKISKNKIDEFVKINTIKL